MRFTRMCRNMFLILSVLGCGILIPVNYTKTSADKDDSWLSRITPLNVWGSAQWGLVVFIWLVNVIVCGFLWWNYRRVLLLRRQFFQSLEYQQSLHARTLMVSLFSCLGLIVDRLLMICLAVRYSQEDVHRRGHCKNHR